MMETDDKLIREFMHGGRSDVADNGFSRRVMGRLPRRNFVPAVVVGVVAVVALSYLMVATGALHDIIMMGRDVIVESLKEGTFFSGLRTLGVLIVGLLVVACQKINSLS